MSEVHLRRLFVALSLPDSIRGQLASLTEAVPGFAWTATDRLHLTMRFLGGVEAPRVDPLIEKLKTVRVEPFILPVEGAGASPPRGPARVAWIGTGRGHPRLFQLRQRIDDAIIASGLNVDMSHFSAHITVARIQEHASDTARSWALAHKNYVAAAMRVDSFALFESLLDQDGPRYAEVLRVRF